MGTFTENPHRDFEMRSTINSWQEMTFTHGEHTRTLTQTQTEGLRYQYLSSRYNVIFTLCAPVQLFHYVGL